MKDIRTLLITLFFAALALPACGGNFATITSVELKTMIDRNEPGLVIIDSRGLSQYEESHIKGAISVPLAEMDENQALPKVQKDSKLVFYCSGST